MEWLPIMESVADGEPRQITTKDGRPKWRCSVCGRGLNGAREQLADCPCSEKAVKMPCTHRGRVLASSGCCGGPTSTIFSCDVLGACTLDAEVAGLLEWKGKPVTACEPCEMRQR